MLSRRPKSEPAPVACRSDLLPALFLGYNDERTPAAILDVGAGGPHTIEAFAYYRSKVHFLDLFSLDIPNPSSQKAQQQQAYQVFSRALKPYQGTLFDICLFWELLPQLAPGVLRGFSDALRPYLFSESKGYAVGQLFPNELGQRPRYRIQDAQTLAIPPEASQSQQVWSLTELSEKFDCFRPVADRLSPDGRLEILMEAD